MRDLVLREALGDLAEEASQRFRELVRSGREVPYEVREPGAGRPFAQYLPLTERFISEHVPAVASLPAYGAAKSAFADAELADAYLRELSLEIPPTPGRQAEGALLAFLGRLWQGSTDFSLEPSRLEAAICELESCAEAGAGEIEVVVPVAGLQMPVSHLELGTATLVRGDVVEVPAEARDPSGSGRAGWEPQFLAYVRCSAADLEPAEASEEPFEHPEASAQGAPVAARLRAAISALRLFKAGGVALGPHAWTRPGGGRWRRIATGAGRPRGGGYRLAESELGELTAFSRAIESRPARAAVLGRAIARFEAGLERQAPLEALNDHLLALRFLLEGGGPAGTPMPVRVAALCAEPAERDAVKATIDRALALERELWSGDPAPAGGDQRPAVEIAGAVEDLLRAILKDAACGHLGADLRATADEILLADGLAAGEGDASQRGETSEWEPDEPLPAPEEDEEEEPDPERDRETGVIEPIQAGFHQARKGWTPFVPTAEEPSEGRAKMPEPMQESLPRRETREPTMHSNPPLKEWLATAPTPEPPEPGPALRLLDQRPQERERVRNRVATLFPSPETTEWSVGELSYDRRRRATTTP